MNKFFFRVLLLLFYVQFSLSFKMTDECGKPELLTVKISHSDSRDSDDVFQWSVGMVVGLQVHLYWGGVEIPVDFSEWKWSQSVLTSLEQTPQVCNPTFLPANTPRQVTGGWASFGYVYEGGYLLTVTATNLIYGSLTRSYPVIILAPQVTNFVFTRGEVKIQKEEEEEWLTYFPVHIQATFKTKYAGEVGFLQTVKSKTHRGDGQGFFQYVDDPQFYLDTLQDYDIFYYKEHMLAYQEDVIEMADGPGVALVQPERWVEYYANDYLIAAPAFQPDWIPGVGVISTFIVAYQENAVEWHWEGLAKQNKNSWEVAQKACSERYYIEEGWTVFPYAGQRKDRRDGDIWPH